MTMLFPLIAAIAALGFVAAAIAVFFAVRNGKGAAPRAVAAGAQEAGNRDLRR